MNQQDDQAVSRASRQLSVLLRDLVSSDWDARDDATEELGRRLRGEGGGRILAYLQAPGVPSDPDAATRLATLSSIRDLMERIEAGGGQSRSLQDRVQRLRRRVATWEAYQEEADPGTATGAWIVENLGALDRLLALFRARIAQLEAERERIEELIADERARLDELPGSNGRADD